MPLVFRLALVLLETWSQTRRCPFSRAVETSACGVAVRRCVYRDLKPENMMVSEVNGYLKLSDLGFTKRIVDTRAFTMCGTPDYMVRRKGWS